MERNEKAGDAPANYELLTRAIHDRYEELSRGFQKIARYLIQNPNEVAIQSINEIARKSGVHASGLVRFAQLFGYSGFKDLQALFQARLATAASGFSARASALKSELGRHGEAGSAGYLNDLVNRDIASLNRLIEDTSEQELDKAVDLLKGANTIYLVGQLRSAPIVLLLQYVLTMIGRKVNLLDAGGGLATEMAKTMSKQDVLLAVSFRYYAKEVIDVCDDADKRGVPVIGISDTTLSPLARSARVLFTIPEDEYSFSRSLAAPICLAQALVIALAARLESGSGDDPRIPVATETQRGGR